MKIQKQSVYALILCITMHGVSWSASVWRTVNAREAGFSIQMPSVPQIRKGTFIWKQYKGSNSPQFTHLLRRKEGDVYFVDVVDIPKQILTELGSFRAMGSGSKGFFGKNSRIFSRRNLRWKGHPTVIIIGSMTANNTTTFLEYRALLVGRRQYLMAFSSPNRSNLQRDGGRFFRSFQLLKAKR